MKNHKKTGLQVTKQSAKKVHDWLLDAQLLDARFQPVRDTRNVIFPLANKPSLTLKKKIQRQFKDSRLVRQQFLLQNPRKGSLKDSLTGLLSKKELEKLVSGFDSLGNIAIIEIPKGLEKKEKKIAQAVLDSNKSFETVCKKTGAHSGKYRIEPVKILAGKKNLVADYKESGCRFRIHLGKTFFSPRLSFERLRIAHLIQPTETVGAFFAGVGPFPIVFAKHSQMKSAVAIELNPVAVKDLKYNITLNKFQNKIQAVQGDVKKIVPKKFKGFFDRVVMPLPKGAENFLKEALVSLKPTGGIIHFYGFVPTQNPFEEIEQRLNAIAAKNGFKVQIQNHRQVRTFSKDSIQVVIDFWARKMV